MAALPVVSAVITPDGLTVATLELDVSNFNVYSAVPLVFIVG